MHANSNTDFQDPIPVNYKYIPINSTIRNRLLLQSFISEMLHSKQWHYSLHRDFQNCYSTRRSPTGFFSSNSTRVPIHHPHTTYKLHTCVHYIQRILHPGSNSTCRRQRALRVLLHTEGKETFNPEKKFYA